MDYDLWLRLAREHRAAPMPLVVSRFRRHRLSLSSREPAAVTDEAYRVRNRYVENPWERFLSWRTWYRRRTRYARAPLR
jgi:hypothetical protein